MNDFVFINGDEDLLASCNGEFKGLVTNISRVKANGRRIVKIRIDTDINVLELVVPAAISMKVFTTMRKDDVIKFTCDNGFITMIKRGRWMISEETGDWKMTYD